MITESALLEDEDLIQLELSPTTRTFRLREMYWEKTHNGSLVRKEISGSGDDSLTGHAKDFAILLEASDPFIQPDELIVGSALAIPHGGKGVNLGYYNTHYPPGHETILRMGLAGIRDEAQERLSTETDPEKLDFLQAVAISYDAACQYVEKHAAYASELAAEESDPQRKEDLEKVAAVCHELATGKPTSFHAALQLVQFTRVFGGRGCIGRFDQWVYPFYKKDISEGKITQEEAIKILEDVHEKGFVHCAYFKKDFARRFVAICNCCSCCCQGMKAWDMFGGAIPLLAPSGWVAEIDDTCMGCGDCVDSCNFFAISMSNEQVAVIDRDKCMGCGVCESKCGTSSIYLKKDPSKGEPLDIAELLAKQN